MRSSTPISVDDKISTDLANLQYDTTYLVLYTKGMTVNVISLTIQKIMSKNNFKKEMLHNICFANEIFNRDWKMAVQAALEQWSAIRVAIEEKDHKTLEKLIASHQGEVNEADKDGVTPLHRAAEKNDYIAILDLLDVPGINVNARNNQGETPAEAALRCGNYNAFYKLHNPADRSFFGSDYSIIKNEAMNVIFERLLFGRCTEKEVIRYGTSNEPNYKQALKERLFAYIRTLPMSAAIEQCTKITKNDPSSQLAKVFWGRRGISEPSLSRGTLYEIVKEMARLQEELEKSRNKQNNSDIELKPLMLKR